MCKKWENFRFFGKGITKKNFEKSTKMLPPAVKSTFWVEKRGNFKFLEGKKRKILKKIPKP